MSLGAIPEDSLAYKYLSDRGVSGAFATECGALWTDDEALVRQRLGLRPLGNPLNVSFGKHTYLGCELLSFPFPKVRSWFLNKVLPAIDDKTRGFRTTLGAKQPRFIPPAVYESAKDASKPLLLTEGPVKALALLQAGGLAIGLGGCYVTEKVKGKGRLRQLMTVLSDEINFYGRRVYLVMDADQPFNRKVRMQALRNYMALTVAGAEVWQLTSWDKNDGKGIDDYIYSQKKDQGREPSETLALLLKAARPFAQTLCSNDLGLLERSLARIKMTEAQHADFARIFHAQLKVKASAFGKYRQASTNGDKDESAQGVFEFIKPWPERVELAKAVTEVVDLYQRFMFMTEPQAVVTVLWEGTSFFSHLLEIQAYLAISAPARDCGKTTLFTLASLFCHRPLITSNLTSSYLFRTVDEYQPTLMTDEAHVVLQKNEDLAAIYNAGHVKRTAYVGRIVKEGVGRAERLIPKRFHTFCPKVLAFKGKLRDESLQEKVIEIRLLHAVGSELKADFWEVLRDNFEYFTPFRQRWVRAMDDILLAVKAHRPSLPAYVTGRVKQNWYPLWPLAELTGDKCTEKLEAGLQGCLKEGARELPFTDRLLKGILAFCQAYPSSPKVQARKPEQRDHIPTVELVSALNEDEEAPWKKDDKSLTKEKLASELRGFGVYPHQRYIGPKQVRSYSCRALVKICRRFLKNKFSP